MSQAAYHRLADPINQLALPLVLSLLIISTQALALPEDRTLPLQVQAQRMQWDNQQQQATYQGDVEVHQGELVIKSAKLVLIRTRTGELSQALATTPQGQAYMRDRPDTAKPQVEAWAESIDYLPANNLITLTGQAKLTQGADSFTGHKLTYNLITQDLQAEQKNTQDSRVEVILTPAKPGSKP